MWKEKIIDTLELTFVIYVGFMIGMPISIEMGFDDYKVYAPALPMLPVQTAPFFGDITA